MLSKIDDLLIHDKNSLHSYFSEKTQGQDVTPPPGESRFSVKIFETLKGLQMNASSGQIQRKSGTCCFGCEVYIMVISDW